MSLMKLTKAQLIEKIESLQCEIAGYQQDVCRLTNEIETLKTSLSEKDILLAQREAPKVRRFNGNPTFAEFCSSSLPVILQPGQHPCSRAFCSSCNEEVPTNRFGVCSRCAPEAYQDFCSAQKAAA